MTELRYDGYKAINSVVRDSMYATHGDPAHHVWLGLLSGVAAVSGALDFTVDDYEKLFAGFITEDEVAGIKELLSEQWLEADVQCLVASLVQMDEEIEAVISFFNKHFQLHLS